VSSEGDGSVKREFEVHVPGERSSAAPGKRHAQRSKLVQTFCLARPSLCTIKQTERPYDAVVDGVSKPPFRDSVKY